MSHLSAVLFPHSGLTGPEWGRALSVFDTVTLCLPWHLDPPEGPARGMGSGAVRIVHPPDDLDPGVSFLKALDEYRDWVRVHGDRSGLSFLKTGTVPGGSEDPLWEIRRRIRESGVPQIPPGAGNGFHGHLVLHLAHELKEQRREADRILNDLREQRSPLVGLTDDSDDIRGLFEDLPGFDWGPEAGSSDLFPTMEAWLGLFAGRLGPDDLLLTLDRGVMDGLAALGSESEDAPGQQPPMLRFSCPDLSGHPMDRVMEIRRTRRTQEASRELGALLHELGTHPSADMKALSERAEELAAFHPEDPAVGRQTLTAIRLPSAPPLSGSPGLGHLPASLSGHIVILLESAS